MERTRKPSLLQLVEDHWESQGWDPKDLAGFRMEADGDGGGEGGDGGDAGGDGGAGGQNGTKTFTQEQVNTLAAREKREGRAAALKEVMQKLGVETVEEAEDILKAHRAAQEATKDEATKAAEAARKAKEEADAERAQAATDRRIAKAERKLVAAGVVARKDDGTVDEEASDKLVARAIKNLDLDFSDDIEDEDLTAAIAELKKELPSLFDGATVSNGSKEVKPKVPAHRQPNGTPPSDSKAKARAQLERMGHLTGKKSD